MIWKAAEVSITELLIHNVFMEELKSFLMNVKEESEKLA